MAHHHHHVSDAARSKRLGRAFWLIAGFMVVEVIGALVANSLTLLADAGHMLLDASALALSWYAVQLSQRADDEQLSYGYHRFQVLAAFLNAIALLALVIWIVLEAVTRFAVPEPMLPGPALGVAAAGLVVNVVAFRMLHGDTNLNVRGAALHVLGDMLGSVAAIAAAVIVMTTGWLYADPILALLVAAILLHGGWRLLRESGFILLEGVPGHLDLEEMKRSLIRTVPGVQEVHHVHAWALTSERPLVTLHATVPENSDTQAVVRAIKTVLSRQFGVWHSTVQVEHGPCPDER